MPHYRARKRSSEALKNSFPGKIEYVELFMPLDDDAHGDTQCAVSISFDSLFITFPCSKQDMLEIENGTPRGISIVQVVLSHNTGAQFNV